MQVNVAPQTLAFLFFKLFCSSFLGRIPPLSSHIMHFLIVTRDRVCRWPGDTPVAPGFAQQQQVLKGWLNPVQGKGSSSSLPLGERQCLENWLAEKEETGGHHVGWRKLGVSHPPWGPQPIAPLGAWCVNHRVLSCQAVERTTWSQFRGTSTEP